MYIIKEVENNFELWIKGTEDCLNKPLYVFNDEKLANDMCEILNTSYSVGYNHGIQLR